MGYLLLLAALFAGLFKGYVGKRTSFSVQSFSDGIFVNMIRCLICSIIGFAVVICQNGFEGFRISTSEFVICLMSAVFSAIFCVSWLYAYKNEAYMFLSIFTMMGTVLTCLLDTIFYNVNISINQWLGMALLLLAVFIMSVYNKGIKGKLTLKGLAILVIGSLGSALADFSQKVYTREIGKSAEIFNFYMYAFSLVLLVVIYIFLKYKKTPKTSHLIYDKKHIFIYFTMAFFLYMNSVSKTMAASFLSSAQIYPVLQGANLILSAVMAHTLFKEKMNLKGLIGISIAFAGLMVMHM